MGREWRLSETGTGTGWNRNTDHTKRNGNVLRCGPPFGPRSSHRTRIIQRISRFLSRVPHSLMASHTSHLSPPPFRPICVVSPIFGLVLIACSTIAVCVPSIYYDCMGNRYTKNQQAGSQAGSHRTPHIYKLFHVRCSIIENELPKCFAFVSNHVTDRSAILF